MIPRKQFTALLQLLNNKSEINDVILLEGARQVGKTTLVQHTLSSNNISFLEINLEENRQFSEKIDQCDSFDDFSNLIQLEFGFIIGGKRILFIDEAQESQKLGTFVRFMKERWPWTQVILTGSSMARIFRNNARFPVGRVTFLHLQSLLFTEFLHAIHPSAAMVLNQLCQQSHVSDVIHREYLNYLQQYLNVGGLPSIVSAYAKGQTNWQRLRQDILLGYYHDFKRVFGEDKQSYFIASLQATADLLGQPFKNAHISRLLDGGKNHHIIDSLSQLESWKMIVTIVQRGSLPNTHFYPKRYMFDIGIAKALRDVAWPRIDLQSTMHAALRTPLAGIVESITALTLCEHGVDICGWKKSSSGSEVDFVLTYNQQIIPVECKAAHSIKNSHLYGLRDYMTIYDIPIAIVVSLAALELRQLSDSQRVLILPLYMIEYWRELLSKC